MISTNILSIILNHQVKMLCPDEIDMNKLLVIAEKPSVAGQIANALGGFHKGADCYESDAVVVSYAFGHLVEIFSPELEQLNFYDLANLPVIPKQFNLRPKKDTVRQLGVLKKFMLRKDISYVVNACDAGREGELIFRLMYEQCGINKPIKRMWIKSMTDDGLREAFKNIRDGREYDRVDQAARGRAEADYMIGLNVTRAVSALKKIESGTNNVSSCGRVQTPVLTLVVERENEIINFVSRPFWEITGTFGLASGKYQGKLVKPLKSSDEDQAEERSRFFNIDDAQMILIKCQGIPPSTVEEKCTISRQKPPKLFNQTELQREAHRRFKFTAQQTLDLTQALYEKHKLVTYPRTSSQALPEDNVNSVKDILKTAFVDTPYGDFACQIMSNAWVNGKNKVIFDDAKITDHSAIIPAPGAKCNLSILNESERKIYDLIVRRFLAAFFPHAEYSETKRFTHVADEVFYTHGQVLLNPGWKALYPQPAGEKSALCALLQGELVKNIAVELKSSQTTPPSRYNVDTLLGAMQTAGKFIKNEELAEAMKECGLGTDATRAGIIEQLTRNKTSMGKPLEPYLNCEGKAQFYVPTEKAMKLIGFLKQSGIEILTSPVLTGEWEHKLSLIEEGKLEKKDFISGIATQTQECVDIIKARTVAITGKTLTPVFSQRGNVANGVKICKCPNCKDNVYRAEDAYHSYACVKCGFKVFGVIAKRIMSESEMIQLITTGRLEARNGYMSKSNKDFTTVLILDKKSGRVSFDFKSH
jgi:DNA topoisomerase-3